MCWRILAATPALILAACATDDLSGRPPELVVEGNVESYPLFEAAAEACGFTSVWRFPGATLGRSTIIPPHFNLFDTASKAGRCVTDWVYDNPETGLRVSYH
jgi:hypothetical protein